MPRPRSRCTIRARNHLATPIVPERRPGEEGSFLPSRLVPGHRPTRSCLNIPPAPRASRSGPPEVSPSQPAPKVSCCSWTAAISDSPCYFVWAIEDYRRTACMRSGVTVLKPVFPRTQPIGAPWCSVSAPARVDGGTNPRAMVYRPCQGRADTLFPNFERNVVPDVAPDYKTVAAV